MKCRKSTSERINKATTPWCAIAPFRKMLQIVGLDDNISFGFQKIMKAWKILGYHSPNIHQEDDVNEVWLILPLSVDKNVTNGQENVTNGQENVTKSTENVTNRPEIVIDQLENVTKAKKRRESLFVILKSNYSVTTKESAEKLNISKRTILRDLEFLSSGFICHNV